MVTPQNRFVYYDEENEYLCLASQEEERILFNLKTGAISKHKVGKVKKRLINLRQYPQFISEFGDEDLETFAKKKTRRILQNSLFYIQV